MNSLTDQQLLSDYAGHRTDAAFAELVRRHVDLVYSAALRMVRDAHLAEDVTQGAFVALAQNARQLADRPVLSGWLHRTTQNLAANTVRSEVRRHAREQEAAAMNELLAAEPNTVWEHIAPHLDAALGELSEPDRDSVLLRYFEKKSAQEMAEVLGISAEAAQKRVHRAVERLREFFAKQKVTVGVSGLAVLISANAIQAAPAALAVTVSTAAALAGSTIATTATATVIKTIAMTTLQKTVVTATLAVVAGAGIYEARQVSSLRNQVQNLQQQQAPLAGQIQELQRDRDEATNRLVSLADEVSKTRSDNIELLKLRREVRWLRLQTNALGKLQAENRKLRSGLTAGPEAPEVKPPPETAPQDTFPRESWTAAGYADPRSAFQSAVLAITKGDVQAYAVSLSPEMLQAKNKEVGDVLQLTGKSEADLAAETAQQYKVVTGYRILDQQFVADDQVVLHVYLDGVGVEKLIRMKKIGNEWKLDAAP